MNWINSGTLQCAAEENCLSKSAYLTEWYNQQYWDPYRTRKLLRFSVSKKKPKKDDCLTLYVQTRVWNRGTADFLPKSARNQWEWHACHAHYHSMENFIDYDLLRNMLNLRVYHLRLSRPLNPESPPSTLINKRKLGPYQGSRRSQSVILP